ncbi:30S ribosomal protein S10 [Lyticum sinuosum]|uniref:Small ribosomal subunit protein uS10 n=1 Tax=Lyticum sinuosum TaxID=1332059 RepID=A0AAE5AHM6_9RICK|nr:30S ribosomal protein S10 [Lyticum sinuosum]MDZ5761191.1 30S ribosomal protein S10 [Lyticum sinuosum]
MSQVIRLELKSYDHRLLDKAVAGIVEIVGDGLNSVVPMPTKIKRFVINKATHAYGYSKERYELRKHKRVLWIRPDAGSMSSLMRMELPHGIEVYIKLVGEENTNS